MRVLLLLLLLAACTPQEQALKPAAQAPALQKEAIITIDGETLPLRSWVPAKKPKAVVVALHGFNDYSNGYARVGDAFRKRGIALFAYDQRGFGASLQPGIWAGEDNLVRDAQTAVSLLKKRYPKTPVFLMGESMGGAVAMLASSRTQPGDLRGVVLIAPAVWGGEAMGFLPRAILWSMAHTVPDKTMTGRDLNILATNNLPVLRRLGADPLVIKATRVDAMYGVANLMGRAQDSASDVKTPVLLLYGGNDQVIPPKPVESVVRKLPKPFDVAYYEDGYHMLTRDIQGDVVITDMADWILKQARQR